MTNPRSLWMACLNWVESWRTPDRHKTRIGLFVLLALFCLVHSVRPLAGDASSDVRQYVELSCNLVRNGTFAHNHENHGDPVPTARREPGWPLLLAVPIALDPTLRAMPSPQIVALFDPVANPSNVRPWSLRMPGLVLLLASGLMAGLLAARAVGHRLAFAPAFLLTAFNPWLSHYADGCFQEALTTPLLLAASLALMRAAAAPRLLNASLAGFAWAALVLTSARFLYLSPIPVFVMCWVAWRSAPPRFLPGLAVGVFCATCALPIGAWMIRNKLQVGEAVVSLRGGRLLAIRASYNTMSGREYLAFSLCRDSSKSRAIDAVGRKLLGDAAFVRLDRENPSGFYFIGKRHGPAAPVMTAGLDPEQARTVVDLALEREGKAAILQSPFWHLAMTVPIAMYGTPNLLAPLGPLNLLCFPVLAWCIWWARRPERRWLLWALLPAAGSIAFCCLLTHNISRYNYIALPEIAVAATIGVWLLAGRLLSRSATRLEPS